MFIKRYTTNVATTTAAAITTTTISIQLQFNRCLLKCTVNSKRTKYKGSP